MAKLKTSHVKEINAFLLEKGLFDLINNYLTENNLSGFEIDSLKLKVKNFENFAEGGFGLVCPPGYKRVEVCTMSGRCEWQCVPK
jgi:hypothetical protein